MKAVLCKAFGPASSLVLEEIASPSPAKNEILLGVHTTGANFPDALIIEDKYQFRSLFPFSPGGEVAGVVAAIDEKVAHVRPGERVMALTGWDNFAEQAKVPDYNAMPIPEGMDFASVATSGMTYDTSMHALKQRVNLQLGEILPVLGASGGVGLAVVEIGRAMGARVITAASTPDRLAVAKAVGADELVNYSEGSLREQLKALTGGQGVDVIYDPVGGELFEETFRSITWNGRMLVVGFASGSILSLPASLTLFKGVSLVGVFWGLFAQRQPQDNADNSRQLFVWHVEGKLKPLVSQRFPLERAGDAIDALGQRKAVDKVTMEVR